MNLSLPNLSAPLPVKAAPSEQDATRTEDIRHAAEGFESLFIATLLKGARAGLPGDDLTGGSAVDSATQMLDAHLAQVMGSRAGFGIAEAVARQFGGDGAKT
ncbi:rod-binding protein [Pseudotabrizicola algicola]|uniref:Flagellar biosynthesis protein FlgJ n=1 Tax=Pseudotabrizicola algicola TaxID=2709381 RepID=A0A6B3RJF7_9RHOB|nr:rod-binding protein [Pseudotabrizicola algicola]NEX45253.1 flagellar biosynthesis protein FlgJ [Pseudotabrizicola algicola]